MAQSPKKQNKKEKTMKYLKFYLVLFILLFVVSLMALSKAIEIQNRGNPLIIHVNESCNNAEQVLNYSFVEGERYNVIKSNLSNGKYTCGVIPTSYTILEGDSLLFNESNLTVEDLTGWR